MSYILYILYIDIHVIWRSENHQKLLILSSQISALQMQISWGSQLWNKTLYLQLTFVNVIGRYWKQPIPVLKMHIISSSIYFFTQIMHCPSSVDMRIFASKYCWIILKSTEISYYTLYYAYGHVIQLCDCMAHSDLAKTYVALILDKCISAFMYKILKNFFFKITFQEIVSN